MSFSNTSTDGDVPLTEVNPTIAIPEGLTQNEYQFSSQDSDEGEIIKDYNIQKPVQYLTGVNLGTGEMPSLEEFPGVYEFSLLMGGNNSAEAKSAKKSWEYSLQMNKLFVKVGCSLPVSFKINSQLDWSGLHVRGLLVYDNPDDSRKPVERCIAHKNLQHKSNQGIESNAVNHVLCSQHSSALYQTDIISGRYSVLVPIGEPQAGATFTTILYALMCKSSCEGGINRRSTSIIFTLEKNNVVVGRHVVRVRICSCPKRDMNQELDALSSNHIQANRGKKRKVDGSAIKIKAEGFGPFPSPVSYPPNCSNSNGDIMLQPRYEPLNYLEVRSPAHYKILLTRAYEMFKFRVTNQAAIYESLLKQVS